MAGSVSSGGNSATETVSGLIVSLLFWFYLLLAASLFASVALAPKLVETLRLRDLYTSNQLKLVAVERQNEQLQRVVEAIQNDQDFAAELTRIEFDAVRSDEEIIPVAADLKLETRGIETPQAHPVLPAAWYRPWLALLTENDSLRATLLSAAAVLVVVSFTWFQPASADRLRKHGGCTVWQTLKDRYTSHGPA
jgi:hypothetical protein